MSELPDHAARVTKTGDDQYRLIIRDGFRQIDEDIDGPKLLAMLGRETLVNTRGEVLPAGEVLFHFDNQKVGEEITIGLVERAA
jgi:hypothetical protein